MTTFRELFAKSTPTELAAAELAEAQRSLLEAYSAVEWAAAHVSYHTKRIARLEAYLHTAGTDTQPPTSYQTKESSHSHIQPM